MTTLDTTENRTHLDTLENGLTVVTVEMPHLHTLDVGMYIRSGVRFETPANNGISHFLEHMLFRGNRNYPNSILLNTEFEKIGRGLRASTYTEHTHYDFSPHYEQLERGMELFSDFFTDPLFPSIEVEREIILEECLEDLNGEGDNIDIDYHACKLLYGDNPLGYPIIGTEGSIKAINEAQLQEFFETYYCPGNMVLAGAGVLTHDRFLALAERYFGRFPKQGRVIPKNYFMGAVKEDQKEPMLLIQTHDDSQAQLQVCFRSVSFNDPDFHIVSLIALIFDDGTASRLQKTLREDRGLVYSVQARETTLSDCGTFDFDVNARSEKVLEITEIILKEIKTFLAEGPSEEELDFVKKRYAYELELEYDSPYKQLIRYGQAQLYTTAISVEEERVLIEKVTIDDVRRVAARLFVRSGLNMVLVGPHTAEIDRALHDLVHGF
ncbi:M16 family metallopeptidase [Nitrospina watsonii]|uniref:Zinc-dependent peptidase, M16 family n=1 Tax=Nitrospina watsonii TaxID=1323948 RepID=A0ABN8W126_9BACT|nr:pitrilysin family protein [Nitrospina watsonii]CAI2718787.1 Zinc-dependent peptidase, M16 family [Nitrospina watsonii]